MSNSSVGGLVILYIDHTMHPGEPLIPAIVLPEIQKSTHFISTYVTEFISSRLTGLCSSCSLFVEKVQTPGSYMALNSLLSQNCQIRKNAMKCEVVIGE